MSSVQQKLSSYNVSIDQYRKAKETADTADDAAAVQQVQQAQKALIDEMIANDPAVKADPTILYGLVANTEIEIAEDIGRDPEATREAFAPTASKFTEWARANDPWQKVAQGLPDDFDVAMESTSDGGKTITDKEVSDIFTKYTGDLWKAVAAGAISKEDALKAIDALPTAVEAQLRPEGGPLGREEAKIMAGVSKYVDAAKAFFRSNEMSWWDQPLDTTDLALQTARDMNAGYDISQAYNDVIKDFTDNPELNQKRQLSLDPATSAANFMKMIAYELKAGKTYQQAADDVIRNLKTKMEEQGFDGFYVDLVQSYFNKYPAQKQELVTLAQLADERYHLGQSY